MRGIVIGVIGLVSCTGGNMMPREQIGQPVPTASGPPPPLDDDPSTQIDKLHADVIARRAALSLPTPPSRLESCEPVCTIEAPPDKPSRTAGCMPGTGAACTTTCMQADAVCDDAAQICALAKDLRTDALAAARCRDARATCADAHAPCCECKAQ